MSCVLSQLNILCITLVKPYCTIMTIHQFFTVHTLRPMTDIYRHDQHVKSGTLTHGYAASWVV